AANVSSQLKSGSAVEPGSAGFRAVAQSASIAVSSTGSASCQKSSNWSQRLRDDFIDVETQLLLPSALTSQPTQLSSAPPSSVSLTWNCFQRPPDRRTKTESSPHAA